MRLIDADALKESLKELKAEGNNGMYVKGLQDAIDDYFPQIIDDAPTIDAEPVRHGHWITDDSKIYLKHKCSECGHEVILKYPYCENCGAEIDGGANNDKS